MTSSNLISAASATVSPAAALSSIAEEATPLLSSPSPSQSPTPPSKQYGVAATSNQPPPPPQKQSQWQNRKTKPLPLTQIFLLCYARIMEPISFFSIFPYIAAMVQRNGRLAPSDVGFYSGLVESLFAIAQTLVLISWGRLADRIGRRPALIFSLAGMSLGPALFGLSSSLPQMILFRSLAGVFSGSTLIIRTMIFDHCTPATQATAFGYFAFAGHVGILLGPIIGGFLADPANQYPGVFGGWRFFDEYPYALPGFVISAFAATGVVTSILFLQETLDKDTTTTTTTTTTTDHHSQDQNGDNDYTSSSAAAKLTILQLLRAKGILLVLVVSSAVNIMACTYTAMLPVFLFTSVRLGGVGLSTFQISLFMLVQGSSQATWLVGAFAPLHRRLGTRGLLMACALAYPFFFLGHVAINVLLRIGTPAAMTWVWIVAVLTVVIGPGVSMAFTGIQLALNDVSPDPHVMGTLNGIALTVSSALRSFMPALTTAVYAVGVRNQILWGHFAWAILTPLSLVLWILIPKLSDDKRPVMVAVDEEEADS